MPKETAVEIIDIYTHKVEKRLDKLGTYLVFIVIPLLLIIATNGSNYNNMPLMTF